MRQTQDFVVEKKTDDLSTGKVFLQRVLENKQGHVGVIHVLSNRIRHMGCPIGPSEELDASFGMSRMADEKTMDVTKIKTVLRGYLSKSSSCAKVFDREWDRYFVSRDIYNINPDEQRSERQKYEDKFVTAWINNTTNHFLRQVEDKGTFTFNPSEYMDKAAGEEEPDLNKQTDTTSKARADKIFNQCKIDLDMPIAENFQPSDKAFKCLDYALGILKEHDEQIVAAGIFTDLNNIPMQNANAIRHLRYLIDQHFLTEKGE
jgi:uncharacterized protein with von Willebrand factor type A (vWA) domain